jgi:hypothetical protein
VTHSSKKLAHSFGPAGDINKDTYNDIAISVVQVSEFYILYGGPSLSPTIDLSVVGSTLYSLVTIEGTSNQVSFCSGFDLN